MDNKGFISIEYLFTIFVILIISVSLLFFIQSTIESSFNIEDSVSHRLILDDVSNSISQVNSNGEGYSKIIYLPSDKGYYEITAENGKITIDYDGKKGEILLPLSNFDSKYKLHSGKSYTVTKNGEGKIVIT
ncbi:hypothetical protein [Methanobrevibacter sp.]|uniref:hypothetical protein n=1 Tax=Methanobrevibacter sp. TaxID=66852 RepID=UPI0025D63F50|nr:hypothetical protein [Methanobrevibacter sp.]MBQ6099903.1 hypothetical protein [Methanobrevibacter sp.]MBQ6513058.1 hypothetical protein [Methanobrevibacter sp.]